MPSTAKWWLSRPVASKILRFDGVPIKADAKVLGATNNCRAYGGGKFPGLRESKVVFDARQEKRQVLVKVSCLPKARKFATMTNPTADGNWRMLQYRARG